MFSDGFGGHAPNKGPGPTAAVQAEAKSPPVDPSRFATQAGVLLQHHSIFDHGSHEFDRSSHEINGLPGSPFL